MICMAVDNTGCPYAGRAAPDPDGPDLDRLSRVFAAAVAAVLDEMVRTGEYDGWLADLKEIALEGPDLIRMVRETGTPDGWSP